MNDRESRLQELLSQYLQGELPDDEQSEFWRFVDDPLFADPLKQLLGEYFSREKENTHLDAIRQHAILSAIFNTDSMPGPEITSVLPPSKGTRRLWPKIAAVAASLLFVLGLGFYFYPSKVDPPYPNAGASEDVAPGRYAATLTLSDGSQIRLSDQTGDIAAESGIRISQTATGELVYTIEAHEALESAGWNMLTTQNAESYQVRLPDGSTVWLNSGTSLSYPTNFASADHRQVELRGEAYFDVARDESKPFRVQTSQQLIEVLGTQFNVNSYVGETGSGLSPPSTVTTLVDGSVRVTMASNLDKDGSTNRIVLQPGEQALDRNGQLQVRRGVDLEEIISWKDGYFKFDDHLQGILARVARWYDIEIEYEYLPPDSLTFSGKISRHKPLSDLLKIISYNDEVHFRIEGRRVIVMP